MNVIKTIQGFLKHFQNVDVSPSRAQELFDELNVVNAPVMAAYETLADFNAQPADFLSLLIELRRKASENDQ